MKKNNSKGFTLIELLIVIALIAVIAGAVFVALNPLQRFQDSRDARRWSDAASILSAIKVSQVDNRGSYISAITAAASNTPLMIGTAASGCNNANCTAVTASANCVNLSELVTKGYLGSIPVSPNENGSWDATLTGYTLTRASSTGAITIKACEVGSISNNPNGISVVR